MGPSRPIRRHDWWRRRHFPDALVTGLGWGTEYWRAAEAFPEYPSLIESAKKFKHPISPIAELTDYLIDDVISAAAAIEYTVERLEAHASVAQSHTDKIGAVMAKPEPEYGNHVSVDGISAAFVEFNNLLSWIRALDERIDRRFPGSPLRSGLLPSLAAGPIRDRVKGLVANLDTALLNDVRPLANFVLHASILPTPMNTTARVRDGRVSLEVPDRTRSREVNTRFDLSYADGQTADGFAREALASVTTFIDGVLDAFEELAPPGRRKSVP